MVHGPLSNVHSSIPVTVEPKNCFQKKVRESSCLETTITITEKISGRITFGEELHLQLHKYPPRELFT